MNITTRVDSGVAILGINGRLTIGTGDVTLRNELLKVLSEGRKKILLDLKGVSYVDSAGLGELIRCKATAASQGAQIKLVHVEERVRKVLLLTQLIGVFESFDDDGVALASF